MGVSDEEDRWLGPASVRKEEVWVGDERRPGLAHGSEPEYGFSRQASENIEDDIIRDEDSVSLHLSVMVVCW